MGRTVINVVRTCGPIRLLYRLFGNKICLNYSFYVFHIDLNLTFKRLHMDSQVGVRFIFTLTKFKQTCSFVKRTNYLTNQ